MAYLHYKILVLKKMLVKLCVGNYETSNGLMNGDDGNLKILQKLFQNL
jgi:hypothetical protein